MSEEERQLEDETGMETYTTEETTYNISVERYWYKQGETFLVLYKAATKVYKKSKSHPDTKQPLCDDDKIFNYPFLYLPDTENIKWRFREKQDNRRFGQKKIKYTVVPFQNSIRDVFSMSTKARKILSLPVETSDGDDLEKLLGKDNRSYIESIRAAKLEEKQRALQDTLEIKTIDLHIKRKELVKEIFKEETPEKLDLLEEKSMVDIVGFKLHPNNATHIACKHRGEYKLFEVDGVLKFLLNQYSYIKTKRGLFVLLPKEEYLYSPPCSIYFLSNHILHYNGASLSFINEIVRTDAYLDMYNEELKKYYDQWQELESKRKKEIPKMELLPTTTTVKPTPVANLKEGEYKAYKYMLRTFRGKEQIILYVEIGNEETLPILGSWLTEELKKMDLPRTDAPIRVRFGERRKTINSNNPDRRTTILHLVDS